MTQKSTPSQKQPPEASQANGPAVSPLTSRKLKGGWIVLVLLLGFFVWGASVPLSKGIVAPGTVVVDSKRKTIQHFEGGVIKSIHVREGAQVEVDTVLIELDDTKARSERDMVRARFLARLAALDRIRAAIENKPTIVFNPMILAAKDELAVREIMRLQQDLHTVLRQEHEGKLAISRQRIIQLEEKLRGFETYLKAIERQIALLELEVSRLDVLRRKQLVEMSVFSERMQQLASQQGELSKTLSSIAETKVGIAEAKLGVVQIYSEWRQELSKQLMEAQESVIELASQLEAAENVHARMVLKSPISGVVLDLKANTVGGVLTTGQPIMDIVPLDDALVLEARVRTMDVDSIFKGMKTHVKFSGFNVKSMPDLLGVVEQISADILADPKGGEPFYTIRVSVSGEELQKLGEREIVPGMPVEIFANAGSRTLVQYLFDPIWSLFRKSLREE